MTDQANKFTVLVTEITAAYVSHNRVALADLPRLILSLRATLAAMSPQGSVVESDLANEPKRTPSQIRKSITPEVLISFIDGKPYKTLKRQLRGHGHDASSYRLKYGLPHDYPMVAPSYSERRSHLAKGRDFGRAARGQSTKAG